MKKYKRHIFYACEKEQTLFELLSAAIQILGFEPKYISIFFDEFSPSFEDLEYDENYLFTVIKKVPGSITLKNKMYDETDPQSSFGFSLNINRDENFNLQSWSLNWLNNDLDFLILSDYFKFFLSFGELVYAYCYDSDDCFEQSNARIINPEFDQPWKTGEEVREFILNNAIDISQHWGKIVVARGLTFIAAPLMWFGKKFEKIIAKEKLLKFACSSIENYSSNELVQIKLFELYDSPSKVENRSKQKEFWTFFDLQQTIKQYEKNNPINAVAWLKARAAAKKKQKNRDK